MTIAAIQFLVGLERRRKVGLVLILDAMIIALSLYLAVALRISTFDLGFYWQGFGATLLGLWVAGTALSFLTAIPWVSMRAFNMHGVRQLVVFSVVLGAGFFCYNYWGPWLVPRSAPLIMIPVLLVGLVGVRVLLGQALARRAPRQDGQDRVLIYGAGAAGLQLANAMREFAGAEAIAFIDDNPSLRKVLVGALRVYGPGDIGKLVRTRGITQIILAMPSTSRARKQEILRGLSEYPVTLRTLPHFLNFVTGEPLTAQVQNVSIDDLLGRLPQSLDLPEIATAYAGQNVLVTGAGGSIGSELCVQLCSVPVARLVLVDHSEFALYSIERRLRASHPQCEIIPILVSVLEKDVLKRAIVDHGIQVVLHAAAYKHVPLVEHNEVVGARNNALGTYVTAEACAETAVARFILISTDKAVRPTNVMGATKRFAEMLVQDLQKRHPGTVFSMVRFGNVLDSSGSVIPLFREQLSKGGPLTVTHPEVTRFFMTLGEAARLVLLAGTFAKGGEVYLLDMGEPIKIVDLARNMIRICGLTERTAANPDGDVAVEFVGLRPGEKLYEELLIGENQIATPHPKIMCARETCPDSDICTEALSRLRAAIAAQDPDAIRALFVETVDGYTNGALRSEPKEQTDKELTPVAATLV
ncbi:nucleoside-diphosphate sugar epimerase/dehydratase [uncultured Roseobacter sp.]|uniref:polysaccharide biosynthesis protein n=1 Tax=uncultured Roseobacter sp. TaxID=114847 RepID=UPI002622C46D|nr:nucleoside-diphosphate sugar epimerase/dehydratase [uncultured Roseobacter sp.]